jgi:hypothetical protein
MLLPDPAERPEERLRQLELLRTRGEISETEYALHRAEIEDEALPSRLLASPPSEV